MCFKKSQCNSMIHGWRLINHTYRAYITNRKIGPARAMKYKKYKAGTGILFGDVQMITLR